MSMTPDREAAERAGFEKWHMDTYRFSAIKDDDGEYESHNTRVRWNAYLARAAQAHADEERLMEYVQHKGDCDLMKSYTYEYFVPDPDKTCTCGLSDLLAQTATHAAAKEGI